jgi:hypothetical protein
MDLTYIRSLVLVSLSKIACPSVVRLSTSRKRATLSARWSSAGGSDTSLQAPRVERVDLPRDAHDNHAVFRLRHSILKLALFADPKYCI